MQGIAARDSSSSSIDVAEARLGLELERSRFRNRADLLAVGCGAIACEQSSLQIYPPPAGRSHSSIARTKRSRANLRRMRAAVPADRTRISERRATIREIGDRVGFEGGTVGRGCCGINHSGAQRSRTGWKQSRASPCANGAGRPARCPKLLVARGRQFDRDVRGGAHHPRASVR
jgi:hypothetical protein